MTGTLLQLFIFLVQLLPLAVAVAIFFGTLALGRENKGSQSATTRGGEQ